MTIRAYVIIQADRQRAGDVIQGALAIPGVVACHPLGGPYDAIAVVEATGPDDLATIAASRIQQIEGVTRTLSCSVVDA